MIFFLRGRREGEGKREEGKKGKGNGKGREGLIFFPKEKGIKKGGKA